MNKLNTKAVINSNYNKEVDELFKTRLEREGNVFYNASNKSFPVNTKLDLALRKKDPDFLLKQLTPLPGVNVNRMESEAKKVAKRIANFVKSGDFRNAMQTTGSVLAIVYLLYANPRFMDNQLNVPLKYPFFKSVGRTIGPPSDKVGLFKQYFGKNLSEYFGIFSASVTTSQSIYESLLSTISKNAYGRSMMGVATQYLAMVVLALISYLPYDKEAKFCRNFLSYIFKILKMLQPRVEKLVVNVVVERVEASKRRTKMMTGALGKAGLIVYKHWLK